MGKETVLRKMVSSRKCIAQLLSGAVSIYCLPVLLHEAARHEHYS